MAIAREAARRDVLRRFYTTLDTASLDRITARLPGPLARPLAARLARRSFAGVPSGAVESLAVIPELRHLALRRIAGAENVAGRSMYASKRAFDRGVARRLLAEPASGAEAVVAMAASGAATLAAAGRSSRFAVLNMVNSHPLFQNRYLAELAGVREGGPEWAPTTLVRAVDREIAAADLVLVPSRFVENQLLDLGVDPAKLHLEPYGVDLSRFRAPAAPRAATSRVRCLYVGQVSHRKGLRTLREVAAQVPEAEFVLAGPIVVRELLRGLPPNVRYAGRLSTAEVAAAMREADIFVLPSVEDAYPLVTLEAMASGLPVIVSDHAGTSELIREGENGFTFAAGDAAALAALIARLGDDARLRARLGAEARRTAEAGRSWDEYASRVVGAVERRVLEA
jgi:glycosyltransferase involved in cell wall biosynthesis